MDNLDSVFDRSLAESPLASLQLATFAIAQQEYPGFEPHWDGGAMLAFVRGLVDGGLRPLFTVIPPVTAEGEHGAFAELIRTVIQQNPWRPSESERGLFRRAVDAGYILTHGRILDMDVFQLGAFGHKTAEQFARICLAKATPYCGPGGNVLAIHLNLPESLDMQIATRAVVKRIPPPEDLRQALKDEQFKPQKQRLAAKEWIILEGRRGKLSIKKIAETLLHQGLIDPVGPRNQSDDRKAIEESTPDPAERSRILKEIESESALESAISQVKRMMEDMRNRGLFDGG